MTGMTSGGAYGKMPCVGCVVQRCSICPYSVSHQTMHAHVTSRQPSATDGSGTGANLDVNVGSFTSLRDLFSTPTAIRAPNSNYPSECEAVGIELESSGSIPDSTPLSLLQGGTT